MTDACSFCGLAVQVHREGVDSRPLLDLGAALHDSPKLRPDTDQSFFFDRDFWVFRLIVAFLRDSTLPESVEELRELYCEASFYRLGLLRHAIEARMIGEDAVAANELQVRLSDSQSAPVEAPAKYRTSLRTKTRHLALLASTVSCLTRLDSPPRNKWLRDTFKTPASAKLSCQKCSLGKHGVPA